MIRSRTRTSVNSTGTNDKGSTLSVIKSIGIEANKPTSGTERKNRKRNKERKQTEHRRAISRINAKEMKKKNHRINRKRNTNIAQI